MVGRKQVVPCRRTKPATVSSASGVASMTSRPPPPWMCTSTKPGARILSPKSTNRAAGGTANSSRGPTLRITSSSITTKPPSITSRGVKIFFAVIATRAISQALSWRWLRLIANTPRLAIR